MKHAHRWGVALRGPDDEKARWMRILNPVGDPFLITVPDSRGDYVALISSQFEGLQTDEEVQASAEKLLPMLNVSMRENHQMEPLQVGDSIEFLEGKTTPKRYFRLKVGTGRLVLRGGFVELTHKGRYGNVIEPKPVPSKAQRWIEAASQNDKIAYAIVVLDGEPNWFDLYKAYEALKSFPPPATIRHEIERFRFSANSMNIRHSPYSKHVKPSKRGKKPPDPMTLNDAERFIVSWLNAAIGDMLEN